MIYAVHVWRRAYIYDNGMYAVRHMILRICCSFYVGIIVALYVWRGSFSYVFRCMDGWVRSDFVYGYVHRGGVYSCMRVGVGAWGRSFSYGYRRVFVPEILAILEIWQFWRLWNFRKILVFRRNCY